MTWISRTVAQVAGTAEALHAEHMNNPSGVVQPRRTVTAQAVADVADTFGLLSDPGRVRLLVALSEGEANVGSLATDCGLSESATSHALRLLRAHRVVEVRRSGRLAFYRLADAHVSQLLTTALAHAAHTQPLHAEAAGLN